MTFNLALYLAVALYAFGTLLALLSMTRPASRLRPLAAGAMIAGLVSHTIWIGSICTLTGRPPITNLPEAASFIAWLVLVVMFFLQIRYKVQAATFFIYPLVLLLMLVPLTVQDAFKTLNPAMRSNIFTAHLLLSMTGVAGLLIGLAFTMLYHLQNRAIKKKVRGRFYDLIPSLQVCDMVSFRSLTIGFGIYTFGIALGILWAYRTGFMTFRVKPFAAIVAWILFAALLQSYLSGSFRTKKNVVVSLAALTAVVVAILGIHRG
ncbi:MAG: cytochrome C assembly family protein [Thermoanaerobaculia bacterium]